MIRLIRLIRNQAWTRREQSGCFGTYEITPKLLSRNSHNSIQIRHGAVAQ